MLLFIRLPAAWASRLFLLLGMVGALGATPALAQVCPAEAYRSPTDLTDGTRVEIVAVHSGDAYYSDRSRIVGLTGRVKGDLHQNDGCWYGGGFIDSSGTDYYFYKVAIRTIGGAPGSSTGASSSGASCPPGAATSNLPEGRRVRIVALHPDDAYYSKASDLIGTTGAVQGDLHSNDGCWMGGGLVSDDGSEYYFYKAAVKDLGSGGSTAGATSEGCPPGASTDSGFADGQRVRIVGLSPEDAYHGQAADIIGLTGAVKDDLHNNGGCWFGGGFTADDGSYYYFYKAAVKPMAGGPAEAPPATSCPPGAVTSKLEEGTQVKVAALHPDDAFYSDRSDVVGLTGRVQGEVHVNDACWLGGGFIADDGEDYYFYKAAFTRVGGATGGRHSGPSVARGARFRIVAVSPDDAYHESRADIIGKTCTADEKLEEMSDGWYAGSVSCTDGSSYYFYKVGLSLQ